MTAHVHECPICLAFLPCDDETCDKKPGWICDECVKNPSPLRDPPLTTEELSELESHFINAHDECIHAGEVIRAARELQGRRSKRKSEANLKARALAIMERWSPKCPEEPAPTITGLCSDILRLIAEREECPWE